MSLIETQITADKLIPPHLNAEVYRTNTMGNYNISYLDYIRLHSDGTVLVGSSELTGRYWDGGATIFENIAEAEGSHPQDNRSITLLSGTADGCFVGSSKKVLLCEDSGAISIWSFADDQQAWPVWREEQSVTEHDAAALAVDCLSPEKEYVTVGADGNAKVWDVNEMICIRHYEAHTNSIFGVSVQPQSTTHFVTCSYDDHITLWDNNIHKPAQDLIQNDCGVSCIQWLDEHTLIFGDEAGILQLLDIRNIKSAFRLTEFPAPVHKVAAKNDKVAVCCDNKIVSVCEISKDSKCKMVYHDRHMHSNFVRGVNWDPQESNLLHSVGWDSAVKTHKIL